MISESRRFFVSPEIGGTVGGGGDCTTVRLIPLLSQDKEMYRNSDADTSNNLNNLDNLNMTEEREKKQTASYKQLWEYSSL